MRKFWCADFGLNVRVLSFLFWSWFWLCALEQSDYLLIVVRFSMVCSAECSRGYFFFCFHRPFQYSASIWYVGLWSCQLFLLPLCLCFPFHGYIQVPLYGFRVLVRNKNVKWHRLHSIAFEVESPRLICVHLPKQQTPSLLLRCYDFGFLELVKFSCVRWLL